MPHILLDDEDEDTTVYNKNVSDILDHTHNYQYTAPFISSSSSDSISSSEQQQGSTVAKTRQELMYEIEDTIEQLISSIALGESIRLFYTRRNSNITIQASNKR